MVLQRSLYNAQYATSY